MYVYVLYIPTELHVISTCTHTYTCMYVLVQYTHACTCYSAISMNMYVCATLLIAHHYTGYAVLNHSVHVTCKGIVYPSAYTLYMLHIYIYVCIDLLLLSMMNIDLE